MNVFSPRAARAAAQDSMPERATRSALSTLRIERDGLTVLAGALESGNGLADAFEAAVALIAAATGRVICTGMGKSGHIARKVAATLASTGTPAYFVHPAEASHGDLGMVQGGDVILALSWSGETAELADIITYARRFRIPLLAMTANREGALARAADACLILPSAAEACPNGLAPTTSTTMQLALGDALAIALLETRGFTAQDFRLFHPGGKLGAKLTYVRDVMHVAERLPLVPRGTPMSEAIYIMTSKGFGCVGVLEGEQLAGIVTDGDLRRHMRPDLMAMSVDEVMSMSPTTIAPQTLAAEALEILNSRKISAVIVVEADARPCGIVHIHDLLRLGAA